MEPTRLYFLISLIITVLINPSAYGQQFDTMLERGDSLSNIYAYDSALDAYHAALKLAIAENDSVKAGNVYIGLGIMSEARSINLLALEYYFKALTLFQALGLTDRLATVNTNIGNLYRKLEDYKHGMPFLTRSLSQWNALKDSARIPYALNNFGLIFMDQDSTEKAMVYFKAMLVTFSKHTTPSLKLSAMSNIASLLMLDKQYSGSLRYYGKSLALANELGDKNKAAAILTNLSLLYSKTHDFRRAMKSQHDAIAIAKNIDALQLLQSGYANYSEIYKAVGDYRKAYAAVAKSMELQDSIYKEVKTRYRLAEADYERQQKEIEIKNLQQEHKLNQLKVKAESKSMEDKLRLLLTILVISVLIIITILLIYRAYQMRQRNERILEKQRSILLENQLKDSELTALRAQMNPHFIFNALSSIKSYILENNNHQADYYLSKFAKLIRLILDNSSQKLVPLEKELQLVESYMELEQLRFENKFVYTFDIETETSIMEIFIPSMIIQPFIENAIIHGFMHKEGKCTLQISIRQQLKALMIIVEDNGIGRLNAKKKTTGIFHESKGYRMTEQRLKALSQNSETNASIQYKDLTDESGNTGTRVEILIPMQQSGMQALP